MSSYRVYLLINAGVFIYIPRYLLCSFSDDMVNISYYQVPGTQEETIYIP